MNSRLRAFTLASQNLGLGNIQIGSRRTREQVLVSAFTPAASVYSHVNPKERLITMLFPFCLSLPSAPPADREVSLKLIDFFSSNFNK